MVAGECQTGNKNDYSDDDVKLKDAPPPLDEGDIALLKSYGLGPYSTSIKLIEEEIKKHQQNVKTLIGIKESDTGLSPPSMWDLVGDKQMMSEEAPLQVARCTKIISAEESDENNGITGSSAAPAAAAGGGVLDTLASLEGPGQVWGADGIAVGKEESDFKEFDNFNLFFDRLNASGVAAELAGAGPFTVFAPVNSAVETYEMMKGPVDADVCRFQVVKGIVASGDVSSADLSTLAGTPLTYRYAVRKHFINDAIVGEKTFGPFSDYPVDVACGNGVVHGMSVVLQQ